MNNEKIWGIVVVAAVIGFILWKDPSLVHSIESFIKSHDKKK